MYFVIGICLLAAVYGYEKYDVFKNNEGQLIFYLHTPGIIRTIPNIETAQELGYDPNKQEIAVVSNDFIANQTLGPPLPDWKFTSKSPDERMRNQIQKCHAVQPCEFWNQSIYLPDIFNPAITRWQNKTLIGWRSGLEESLLVFGWLDETLHKVNKVDKHFGLGYDPNPIIKVFDFNYNQQDERFLVLANGSLLMSYSVYVGSRPHGRFKQCYALATHNSSTGLTTFGDSVLLEHTDGGDDQKNWIPFEYENKIMFVQSISPFHVLEVTGVENRHNGVVKTVSKINYDSLPWKGQYGMPIRGGTAAVVVRGVYLAFFHTLCMFQFPYKLRTYFFGAFTYCASTPFKIHSMSMYPFVQEFLYDGAWVNLKVDYVVFPTGVMLDDDGEHVWVSMGSQDKNAYILKFEIDKLLASLDIVHNCSDSSGHIGHHPHHSNHTDSNNNNNISSSGSNIGVEHVINEHHASADLQDKEDHSNSSSPSYHRQRRLLSDTRHHQHHDRVKLAHLPRPQSPSYRIKTTELKRQSSFRTTHITSSD